MKTAHITSLPSRPSQLLTTSLRSLPALAIIAGGSAILMLAGCGVGTTGAASSSEVAHVQLAGQVHGGNQPVSGATIQLYAVGNSGDGAAALPLIAKAVLSDAAGNFGITGTYTCPTGTTPVYLTATGGNPGLAGTVNNNAIALIASLGPCGALSASTFISINEVTTVGTLAAWFPYATDSSHIGYQTSDASLFSTASASLPSYFNFSEGSAPGLALPTGMYASSREIDALSNSIAACINSPGGIANDGSACGTLFSLATPPLGAAPADTVTAVIDILKNPTNKVSEIFSLASGSPPFQPTVQTAPGMWVLPITSTSNPTISIAVTGAPTVNLGTPAQFSASITGTTNPLLAWRVNGVNGGNATYGTISPSGLYTPPAVVPAANALTISAASLASVTAAGSQPVSLLNPVPVINVATGTTATYGQSFVVDVQGTGFVNGASLLVNGSPVSTTAVSLTDLQTTVTNTSGAALQISVSVANPSPGATQSTSSSVTLSLPPASAAAAGRFLDQTSFGPTAASIAHVQQIGLLAALNEQFNAPTTLLTLPPQNSECSSGTWRCTESDWIKLVVTGNDQLRQRISLMLSELWVAPNSQDGGLPYYLNTMANDAFTNYRTIMQDLGLSPQMGNYLNMLNSGAAPVGQIPNENFGREMMQLFSLGLDLLNPDGSYQLDSSNNPIPAYSEDTVQAFAKAYTGWTWANADGSKPASFTNTTNWNHAMVALQSKHDTTAKTLLNGTTLPAGQTAEDDYKGAMDNIFAHPNIGPFICRQLIQHLVTGAPTPAYVQRVSAVFADNGSGVRGDMKAVLTAILLDTEARANDSLTGDQLEASPINQAGHLREPLIYVPALMRGLGTTPSLGLSDPYPYVGLASFKIASMGEQPFSQASVFNYFPPSYVIPQTTLNAPEFGLENTGSIIPGMTNIDAFLHSSVSYGLATDISATGVLGSKASVPATLIDYLGMIFMHSQMPTDMRTAIINEVTSVPVSNLPERVAVAAYLVLTSPQYKIIH